jgi:hypothetical protein
MPEYGEVHAEARAALAGARLADPNEHFPYKTSDARAAMRRKMAPDEAVKDDVTGADFTSARIIEASEAYVTAQAAYLADPTPAKKVTLDAAADDLVAARKNHRRARVDADGNPVGGVVATTSAPRPDYLRGPRHRRVGED